MSTTQPVISRLKERGWGATTDEHVAGDGTSDGIHDAEASAEV